MMASGGETKSEETSDRTDVCSIQKAGEHIIGITEEIVPVHHRKRPNLFLKVPPRKIEETFADFVSNMPPAPSATPTRANLLRTPTPSSARIIGSPNQPPSRNKSSIKSLLPRLSFKYRNSALDIEKGAIPAIGTPSIGPLKKPSFTTTFSVTKIFTPRTKRTSSLPVTPIAHSNVESIHGGSIVDSPNLIKKEAQRHVTRSLSMPVNRKAKNIRRMDSLGCRFRLVSTPRVREGSGETSNSTPMVNADISDAEGEDIPEEEAVCRICLVELGEGGETLKMECSCRGELALAHQECAVKWFSIKGNKNCDVCKQEVRNLPVTLLRIQNIETIGRNGNTGHHMATLQYRIWHDMPILVIVGMLGYFCFLEQLLVGKMGTSAIAISLPFSCILGLLASMTSSTMVKRKYIWVYATVQFTLVVVFAHLFYSLLHVQAMLSILLATVIGFGVTVCTSSIFVEFLRWRRRWHLWSDNHQSPREPLQESRLPESRNPSPMAAGPRGIRETRIQNLGTS